MNEQTAETTHMSDLLPDACERLADYWEEASKVEAEVGSALLGCARDHLGFPPEGLVWRRTSDDMWDVYELTISPGGAITDA